MRWALCCFVVVCLRDGVLAYFARSLSLVVFCSFIDAIDATTEVHFPLRVPGPGPPPATPPRSVANLAEVAQGRDPVVGRRQVRCTAHRRSQEVLLLSSTWSAPTPRISAGRSAVAKIIGMESRSASQAAGSKLATAVPDVVTTQAQLPLLARVAQRVARASCITQRT